MLKSALALQHPHHPPPPPPPPPLVFSLLFASFASSLFIIELGHSASVRHSKALPVMRPENTSGANGKDARYGGARAGAWANCKWRWALASRNGEKTKQNNRRFLYEVCCKTYKTGKGSEGKLATQRSRNPIYFFHLRRDTAGQGLHSITCDIREKARTRKAFRRPQNGGLPRRR